MTVERKQRKKQNQTAFSSKKPSNFDFSSLDALIQTIDTLETEEQVPELIENEELLEKSFKSLMSLIGSSGESEFDESAAEKVDESVTEIMSKFLDDEIIDEEEFEDFFEEDEDSVEDSEDDGSEESESETELKTSPKPEKHKKSKNLRELEMLMEKVEDESDMDDDYETEESEEDEAEISGSEDDEKSGKMDMFNEDENSEQRMSSFERAQAALKDQIAALETENVESARPWSLRGEINARQRPSDSLLEEAVDFDNLSRPVPQITEERTEEIEDVIKRRIGEAAWDDVERKDGRDLTLLNGMTRGDQQKSARVLLEDVATAGPQRSLAQVYEDEAATKLTGQSAQSEEMKEKQGELTALFAKICRHVDGLSGNRFAPKVYVQSDFQIKTLKK